MELVIKNKGEFIAKFLKPVCNISDSGCLKIDNGKITSISATQDTTVILFAQSKIDITIDKPLTLNCPDLRRLERVISALDRQDIPLKYSNNNLTYNDGKVRFTYHLLEQGILNSPTLNADKIARLEFNVVFDLEYSKVGELIKGSTFATTASKLYISFNDGKIYGEIADKTNPLLDTFATVIHEDYKTAEQYNDIPINFDVLKIISGVKFNRVSVKINTKLGVVVFEISEEDYKLKYIVSALMV